MKLREKILYMSFGAGLVVLGIVLNILVTDADAEAQSDGLDMNFRDITCRVITIVDDNGKPKGVFGLSTVGDAMFSILGDDGESTESTIAYLGGNPKDGEMMFFLKSKSKTDKRSVSMHIDGNGGRFDSSNKMGEMVARLVVGDDGGGFVDLRDKYGYTR